MNFCHYKILNEIIRQKKINGEYVIDRQKLANCIDLSEEDPEEKDDMLKTYMICNMLNQNNYRSVRKSQGIFIDVDALKSKTIANILVNNESLEVDTRKAALKELERIAADLPEDDCQQMAFDDDGILFQEMSRQELIDLIRELQEKQEMTS